MGPTTISDAAEGASGRQFWGARARFSRGGCQLSPSLPRAQLAHVDGATTRAVQWYFDNLLPEEATYLASQPQVAEET